MTTKLLPLFLVILSSFSTRSHQLSIDDLSPCHLKLLEAQETIRSIASRIEEKESMISDITDKIIENVKEILEATGHIPITTTSSSPTTTSNNWVELSWSGSGSGDGFGDQEEGDDVWEEGSGSGEITWPELEVIGKPFTTTKQPETLTTETTTTEKPTTTEPFETTTYTTPSITITTTTKPSTTTTTTTEPSTTTTTTEPSITTTTKPSTTTTTEPSTTTTNSTTTTEPSRTAPHITEIEVGSGYPYYDTEGSGGYQSLYATYGSGGYPFGSYGSGYPHFDEEDA